MDLIRICKNFKIEGSFAGYNTIVNGNINTSYKVSFLNKGNIELYFLQRINGNVFKNPNNVMENIVNVTSFLRAKDENYPLVFFVSKSGKSYVQDENGDFWRCRRYVDCIAYDHPEDMGIIENAGYAFGCFQRDLSDFDVKCLKTIIDDFHNTEKRIDNLEMAIDFCMDEKKDRCSDLIEYIISHKEEACLLENMLREGKLPIRVTHNDTKCNNVIFDKETGKPIAVIDLDTIMPGLSAYDFGDGARSICSITDEDEEDLTKVGFSLEKFEAFTKGFLTPLKGCFTKHEIEVLPISVFILTLELGSRFLEDFLSGDIYFKVKKFEHNYYRARCQVSLCKDIYSKLDKMKEIVNKYAK